MCSAAAVRHNGYHCKETLHAKEACRISRLPEVGVMCMCALVHMLRARSASAPESPTSLPALPGLRLRHNLDCLRSHLTPFLVVTTTPADPWTKGRSAGYKRAPPQPRQTKVRHSCQGTTNVQVVGEPGGGNHHDPCIATWALAARVCGARRYQSPSLPHQGALLLWPPSACWPKPAMGATSSVPPRPLYQQEACPSFACWHRYRLGDQLPVPRRRQAYSGQEDTMPAPRLMGGSEEESICICGTHNVRWALQGCLGLSLQAAAICEQALARQQRSANARAMYQAMQCLLCAGRGRNGAHLSYPRGGGRQIVRPTLQCCRHNRARK